ncbi:MAG: exonuclease SbcCD subunit D [Planctomycetota bacterium]
MSFRFLHLADLHLDTAFGGRPEARERLMRATHEALTQAVDLCIEEALHALLIAGDAFDEEKLSLRTEGFFLEEMARLNRAGVQVFYCTGNHDPGRASGRAAQLGFVDAPETVGPEAGLWQFRGAIPRAVTVLDRKGAAVGVVLGAGHNTDRVENNLAERFRRPETELPVIGLLHTQVENAGGGSDHARYAPSARADYEAARLDYWALGHVHLRQQVFADLPVWYSGNLQGRNVRETGPKGGLLVEAHANAAADCRFVPLAPVEWYLESVADLADCTTTDHLYKKLEQALRQVAQRANKPAERLCVRLVLEGTCPLSALLHDATQRTELEEDLLRDCGYLEVQLRPGALRAPWDLSELEATPCVQREALDLVRRLAEDDAALLELAPADLPGANASTTSDREARLAYLRERLAGLEEELLERCFEGGGAS